MKRVRELDRRARRAAGDVKVLRRLAWPERTVQSFLTSWRRGAPRLPKVPARARDLSAARGALDAVIAEASPDDPLEGYVRRTAESYRDAARMVEAAGTPEFAELSRAIYGHPRDRIQGSAMTHLDAAQRLLTNTERLQAAGVVREADICITPETVRAQLDQDLRRTLGDATPKIVIDRSLASKAAAGALRIRIRGKTAFSELDIAQLREHEGLVHSATALNGRAQRNLSCMRLSSPRTTRTQEGLATVAELITRAVDIARLRRLALRTVAIDAALDGADFVQVFEVFLNAGQSEEESARSAMRVFRGGDVRGRVAFTKDVVYLAGMIEVHTFLRKAIELSRPDLVARLFAGRLTLGDVTRMSEAFEAGHVKPARHVPEWATDLPRLAAYLAFNALVDLVDLREVTLEDV